MNKVLFASDKMDWGTPDSVYQPLDNEFIFALDVACTTKNQKCWAGLALDKGFDGLIHKWEPLSHNGEQGACWMNPPYGREIGKWIQKAYDEKLNGITTVCLVPARTDTQWWAIFWDHEKNCVRDPADEVRFVKGRIKFDGAPASAPFPSAILVFRAHVNKMWCPQCQNHIRIDDECTKTRSCGLRAENRVETANQ